MNARFSFIATLLLLLSHVSIARAALVAGPPTPVVLPESGATATFEQGGFPASEAVNGVIDNNDGWAISGVNSTEDAVFQTAGAPVFGDAGSRLTFTMEFPRLDRHTIGHMRWFVTSDASPTASNINTTNWIPLTPTSATGTSLETWLVSPASDAFGDGSPNRILWDPNQGAPGSAGPAETLTILADTSVTNITGFRLEAIFSSNIFSGTGDRSGPGLTSVNGNFVFSELLITSQALAIPEPSTGMLGALTVGSALYWRRRKPSAAGR